MLRSMAPGTTVEELEEIFAKPPMSIQVRDAVLENDGVSDHLVIFSYDLTNTKFSDPEYAGICKEARGIILRMGTWEVVCYAFDKFFNVGEGHADPVDWAESVVEEKLDGSLIKVWYNTVLDHWVVSTNGSIDARRVHRTSMGEGKTFFTLFQDAAALSGFDYNRLLRSRAYLFELMHPANIIVIAHEKPRLVHIGTRDIHTLREVLDDDIGVERPQRFPLSDVSSCMRAAAVLPNDVEGYVVVDRSQYPERVRRVKIKSPKYVVFHHLEARLRDPRQASAMVLLCGETEEVQAYADAPVVQRAFGALAELQATYDQLIERLEAIWAELVATVPQGVDEKATRKHIALGAKQIEGMPGHCFSVLMSRMQRWLDKSTPEAALPTFDALMRARFAKVKSGVPMADCDAKGLAKLLEDPWVVTSSSPVAEEAQSR